MKTNTIKWRIFKYNMIVIMLLITFVAIIFNISIQAYIEKNIAKQLSKIGATIEETTLGGGSDFFMGRMGMARGGKMQDAMGRGMLEAQQYRFYYKLDRASRESLSVLNADYILLDNDKKRIVVTEEGLATQTSELQGQITAQVIKSGELLEESYLNLNISNNQYVAIIKPVSGKNNFGLGWIIIYSGIQKVNQLKWAINGILIIILIFSAFILALFSAFASKKISQPFESLSSHIKSIAERNFADKVKMPVDDELKELVNNINLMSEKLESYDKAQKTFLQNASHEFRTPLMSIQSYAEGIKYAVIEKDAGVDIIIDESKRMTHLVEDLLYLSRLDAIEENYSFSKLDIKELIMSVAERMNGIAAKNSIAIDINSTHDNAYVLADEEMLSRALTNIVSNCIRYAKSGVWISSEIIADKVQIIISDDGPGFEENELPNIFERFYKGKKGNYGLGLAISQNIIIKHGGDITAENRNKGALFKIRLPIYPADNRN